MTAGASAAALLDAQTGGAVGPAPNEPTLGGTSAPQKHDLTLQAQQLSARVGGAVTGAAFTETMDGASTLEITLDDPDDVLVKDPLLQHAVRVQLFHHEYVLVKVSSRSPALTLTFEDAAIYALRQRDDPLKADRAKVTRAEFILQMLREVRDAERLKDGKQDIGFHAPELHKRQTIAPITTP